MSESKIPGWVTEDFLAEMRRLEGSSKMNPMKDTRVTMEAWLLDTKNNGVGTWIGAEPGGRSYLTGAGHIALLDMAGPSRIHGNCMDGECDWCNEDEGSAPHIAKACDEYWLIAPGGRETIHVSPSCDSHITFTKSGRYQVVLPGQKASNTFMVVPDRLVGVPIDDISALKFETEEPRKMLPDFELATGHQLDQLANCVGIERQGEEDDFDLRRSMRAWAAANNDRRVTGEPVIEFLRRTIGDVPDLGEPVWTPSVGDRVRVKGGSHSIGIIGEVVGTRGGANGDLLSVNVEGEHSFHGFTVKAENLEPAKKPRISDVVGIDVTLTPVPCAKSYSYSMEEIRAAEAQSVERESRYYHRLVDQLLNYPGRSQDPMDYANHPDNRRADGHIHGPILTGNARESYLAIHSGAPDPHATPEPTPAEPACGYCKDTGIGKMGMECPVRTCEAVSS